MLDTDSPKTKCLQYRSNDGEGRTPSQTDNYSLYCVTFNFR